MIDASNIENFFDTEKANCRGKNIVMFYPNHSPTDRLGRDNAANAIQICSECEVVEGCLDYALHYEPLGFWGGKTEVEREVLRRVRGIHLPPERQPSDSIRRSSRRGFINSQVRKSLSSIKNEQ
jgi:WhiB family redox-sensing transcriptional regulator